MRRRVPKHALTSTQRTMLSQFVEEARKAVHADHKKAPIPFSTFLLHLERTMFTPDCSIGEARLAANIKSNSYSARFCQITGKRPWDYVEHHRIMLARRIIRHIPLYYWEVATLVGIPDPSVFSRTYGRILGHTPTEEAWAGDPPPVSPSTPSEATAATLDPRISTNTAELETKMPGLNLDRFWNDVSNLGRPAIKDYLIENRAKLAIHHHHYLLDKARYEGRMDRGRGEELCLAALDTLRLVEFQQGTSHPDETALAYANLANMRRLRFDFPGARDAFTTADRFLPRSPEEKPLLFAQVHSLRISLLWWQRDVEEAIALHHRLLPTIRESGSHNLLARSLIRAADIYDHWGHPEKAIPYLAEALGLAQYIDDLYLVFSAHFNLTHLYARSGNGVEADRCMQHVRTLHDAVKEQIDPFHMTYLEGQVCRALQQRKKAEKFFLEAREGYLTGNRDIYAALTALDLATLYLDMDNPERARDMATSAMEPITRMGAHREAVAALAVLQETQRHEVLTQAAITKAVHHLDTIRKDPTANAPAKS